MATCLSPTCRWAPRRSLCTFRKVVKPSTPLQPCDTVVSESVDRWTRRLPRVTDGVMGGARGTHSACQRTDLTLRRSGFRSPSLTIPFTHRPSLLFTKCLSLLVQLLSLRRSNAMVSIAPFPTKIWSTMGYSGLCHLYKDAGRVYLFILVVQEIRLGGQVSATFNAQKNSSLKSSGLSCLSKAIRPGEHFPLFLIWGYSTIKWWRIIRNSAVNHFKYAPRILLRHTQWRQFECVSDSTIGVRCWSYFSM